MADWHLVGALGEFPAGELVPRTIGGTNIVLVRTGESVAALMDRCPHRFAPLSMGKFADGTMQCAYHGLRFGLDGACVFNPHGDGKIPELARVAAYPVELRDGQIFVALD